MSKPTKQKPHPKQPAPQKAPLVPRARRETGGAPLTRAPKPDQQKRDTYEVAIQEAQHELRVRDEEIRTLKGELQTLKDQLQRQQMRSHEHQRLEAIRLANHGGVPK